MILKHSGFGLAHALINNQLRRICSLTLIFLLGIIFIPTNLFAKEKHEKRYGGTLRAGFGIDYAGLHPFYASHGLGAVINFLINTSLFDVKINNSVEPLIVESWKCNDEENYCDLKIREDVYFHDNSKLTVDDIIFTYDLARRYDIEHLNLIFDLLEEYEKISRYKLRLKFKNNIANKLAYIDTFILPKHVYGHKELDYELYESSAVGAGPFIYDRKNGNNEIILKANEKYFGGRPYFDELTLKSYTDNSELWGGMLKGDLDLALYLSAQDIGILEKDTDFKIYKSPNVSIKSIYLNYNKDLVKDKRFRQALSYAIDRDNLVGRMTYGYGDTICKLFESTERGSRIHKHEYSIEQARRLFREIGFVYDEQKHIWIKNNQILELKILVFSEFEYDMELVMLIRQNLSKLGIRLRVVKKSFLDDESIKKAEVDCILWGKVSIAQGDFLASLKNEKEALAKYGIAFFDSHELDGLTDMYRKAVDASLPLFDIERKIEKVFMDNKFFIYLYSSSPVHAIRSEIRNGDIFFEEETFFKLMHLYREN